jgi:hypothetical protein
MEQPKIEVKKAPDRRKDYAIILLAFLVAVGWLLGKYDDKFPSWTAWVIVGLPAVYYVYKYFQVNPYPPNVEGAKRAAKQYVADTQLGLGPKDADFTFWNVEVQELSPTAFLVGIHRKDQRDIVLIYRAGQGITTDRKRGIVKTVKEIESSDLARKAIEGSGEISSRYLNNFLREYGIGENEQF